MQLSKRSWLILVPILVMAVGLRLYSLDADPDWRLDWNPGLLTDEAFYMHNARNQVLFGQANLDEFNNAVLSPVVHWMHVWVFTHFGVGYVQGRLVSVMLGLLSVGLFWRILWLAFRGAGCESRSVREASLLAAIGAAGFAYEHLYLLYNRTALLETPVAFFCMLSLWGFAEALVCRAKWGVVLWAVLAGLGAVLALATKLTSLPFVLALVFGAMFAPSLRSEGTAQPLRIALIGSLLVGCALWYSLWLLPHWDTWSRMQSFYMRVQGMPHSWAEGWHALQTALIGERYGLMQFLFLHAPLAWFASLVVLAGVLRSRTLRASLTPIEWVFLLWVVLGWLQMMGMRIAPTRYTIAFVPAMVALLWVAVARAEGLRPLWSERDGWSWLARTAILGWMLYFLLLLALPGVEWCTLEFPVLDDASRGRLLLVALLMGSVGAWYLVWQPRSGLRREAPPSQREQTASPVNSGSFRAGIWLPLPAFGLLIVGILLNTPWYLSYFGSRTYQLKNFNQALTRTLPEGTVLVGVAFETPFRYFFVFRGLCNDRQPPQALGATHVLVIGSEETLIRFWTSGADLSHWYAVPERVEPAAHPMLRGRVGPYRLLVYALPRIAPSGWRESLLRAHPRLAPNTLLEPPVGDSLIRAVAP